MTISDDVIWNDRARPDQHGYSADVAAPPARKSTVRHYAMTAPQYFTVEYAINPWMDLTTGVDTQRAVDQWRVLHDIYVDLGHTVDLVPPRGGLPDMVYAANGGFVIGRTAVIARFAYPQRAPEAEAYAQWAAAHGLETVFTQHVNEGQGDLLLVGSNLLAGWGFRTDRRAHDEIAAITGLPVLSLELVDPRFYHLDTALAVLDDTTVAYYPPAFSPDSRRRLEELFPAAIEVATSDAYVLGLNVVSDGKHVVLPAAATGFADQLRRAGFEPIGVDLAELLKGGGSVKCCTLELHP
ncbi:dimethylargininase [Mycolicibacterium goodii]|uniref:N-dimethylarginine dimethylaminohydrolase n=1 Tax=Mycolicibacterium goodii TaxID=134601 RepID=A0ABS6HVV9_MYCGD|nr:dimethylargininase [Mycolicibacterium goodii]MBU8825517.1 N-dimethylarginine dimethylaminohydrolase [Mycolicibacterium goodii]MBU8838663.1 N-dimethylarginine dimethylaminohydrolase [Mycolicibacterium goodii]